MVCILYIIIVASSFVSFHPLYIDCVSTRSDGELDVVCPAQQLVVTMVISVIHLI